MPKRALYSPPPPTGSAAQFAAAQVPNTATKRPCISAAKSLANCARNPSLTNQVSRRMSVSPSAQTTAPVDPTNAAPLCGCTGCQSFWLPQLRRLASLGWVAAGSAPEPHPLHCVPALHSKSTPPHRQRERPPDTPHQPGSLEASGSENGHSPLTTVATTPALRRRVTPQSAEHATQLLQASNSIAPVEILSRCVQTDARPNPISGPASGRRCPTHHVSLQLPSVDNSSLPTQ
eukprot:COSAG04_NODE_2998_length_3295_cov_115.756342_2_plen_233_part_00